LAKSWLSKTAIKINMRHFLSINDIPREEAEYLLVEATRLKLELKEHPARQRESLQGKTLAMVFEKPSLRTRVSFDVGMNHLGGHALYLSPQEIGLGTRESVADVARVLSRMCDGIMARVFKHETVEELARWSQVPVINGLSDKEHPCQAMADLLTLKERKGLEGRKIAYLGDGNNVCHSLMILCAKLGVHFSVAAPEGYEPHESFVATAKEEAAHTGAQIEVVRDPKLAAQNADALYTDVWTSMGQEEESRQRAEVFPPYQLNAELLRYARPDAIVLHDLPAHKGEEISEEVFEAHADTIFSQAENRLHAQKAIVAWLLGSEEF
jgi:ornithine carbamoyltransferase